MQASKTIVLYSPHFAPLAMRDRTRYRAVPPLSLLAVAGPLRDAGYRVVLLDARWDSDWRSKLDQLADSLLCVGVTSLTGPAVSDGLEFSAYAKRLRPDVPVVWGGWHATYAADQAMEDPRVDVVVRGFGERSFVEVARAIESRQPLDAIAGIHFRDSQGIRQTPDRPLEDINDFPPPAYDLIQPERYIAQLADGGRLAGTIFSRGCPYACEFCLDSRKKWIGLSLDRMLADIEFWIARGANRIQFYDGNFFLGRARLMAFCDALIERGLNKRFQWTATAVGRRLAGMDDDLLARLRLAGLSHVAVGAESGSDELLARITNKTTVESTLEAVRRLTRHGIDPYLFFLVGYPDEPADALDRTLSLVLRIKQINPRIGLFLNFATPLPGSEVFRMAIERGMIAKPEVFEDWARFDYMKPNLLGTTPEYESRVQRFLKVLNVGYPAPGSRWLPAAVRSFARWHLERNALDFPVAAIPSDSAVPSRTITIT